MNKILVIEDQAHVREIIVEILEAEDFSAIEAEDGQMGVTLAAQDLPDLILCDLMMPKLDGFATIAQLKKTAVAQDIPVIFLTAQVTQEDMRQGMNLGADDYLTKPFTRNELMDAVTAGLKRSPQHQQPQPLAAICQ